MQKSKENLVGGSFKNQNAVEFKEKLSATGILAVCFGRQAMTKSVMKHCARGHSGVVRLVHVQMNICIC